MTSTRAISSLALRLSESKPRSVSLIWIFQSSSPMMMRTQWWTVVKTIQPTMMISHLSEERKILFLFYFW
jgi:hypothetical protein